MYRICFFGDRRSGKSTDAAKRFADAGVDTGVEGILVEVPHATEGTLEHITQLSVGYHMIIVESDLHPDAWGAADFFDEIVHYTGSAVGYTTADGVHHAADKQVVVVK
jgi:hypothetical protein